MALRKRRRRKKTRKGKRGKKKGNEGKRKKEEEEDKEILTFIVWQDGQWTDNLGNQTQKVKTTWEGGSE
jgi:hypothetical protein